MPKYAVSTFGRNYIQDEELEELPTVRFIFIIVTLLLGLGTLLKFLQHFFNITTTKEKTCNYFPLSSSSIRIVICYAISHIIHTIHFADNIARPVDYFEPRWLYDKLLLSEMEITFFANFPISLCGLFFMERFVTSASKRNYAGVASSCRKMSWYVFGSFLTLGHYRTEPPWSYSTFVNFTIAGEGIATFVLALWLYQSYKASMRMASSSNEEDSFHLLNRERSKNL